MAFIYSLKDINARIQRDIHAKLELVKGDGYHYFQFDDVEANVFETHSVMVAYTKQLTLAQWLEEARGFADRVAPKPVQSDSEYGDKVQGAATPKHQQIAEELRDALLRKHNAGKDLDKYKADEVKKFELAHFPGGSTTFMVIDIGLIGDEGTMASVFCRDYRHIAISKRGGLKLLNPKVKRNAEGRWNVIHALTR